MTENDLRALAGGPVVMRAFLTTPRCHPVGNRARLNNPNHTFALSGCGIH
jgi:hypothetical protein